MKQFNQRSRGKARLALTASTMLAIAFTLLIGCGEEKVVELDSLQQRGGVYVVPETQKPYSGKFVITKGNTVKEAGSLKKGKRHGETTTYREDGSVDKVETFADDVLNGKSEEYYGGGKIEYAGNYKNGEKDGKWERYYKNGKLMRVEHYKDGKRDGKRELYDENGKKLVLGSFTDSRDKKAYSTAKIGEQVWMAENLNYNASDSKCYGNEPANCEEYGRLYYWAAAMKSCPSGWHLPNDDEWQKLVYIAGGDKAAGAVLKAASGWADDGNGTDGFGFSALPGGYGGIRLDGSGSFSYAGINGVWWSATEYNSYNANIWNMTFVDESVGRYYDYKSGSSLFSVRCVQD